MCRCSTCEDDTVRRVNWSFVDEKAVKGEENTKVEGLRRCIVQSSCIVVAWVSIGVARLGMSIRLPLLDRLEVVRYGMFPNCFFCNFASKVRVA